MVRNERRHAQNQAQVQRDRDSLNDARSALVKFRRDGNPEDFPALRKHLMLKSIGLSVRRFYLDGFGRDDMGLTEAGYDSIKEAYKATESGKAETEDFGDW